MRWRAQCDEWRRHGSGRRSLRRGIVAFFFGLAFAVAGCADPPPDPPSNAVACVKQWPEPAPGCGDGRVTGDETCDDGNTEDDDGCDRDCQPSRIEDLSVGLNWACALTRSGNVHCWGDAERLSSLAAFPDSGRAVAGEVAPLNLCRPATALSGGRRHMCAQMGEQTSCFGQLGYAPLGMGADNDKRVSADSPLPWVGGQLSDRTTATGSITCSEDGLGLNCWGRSDAFFDPEFGNSDENPGSASRPLRLDALSTEPMLIAEEWDFACVASGSTVSCFGTSPIAAYGSGDASPVCIDEGDLRCDRHQSCCFGDDEPLIGSSSFDAGARVVEIDLDDLYACIRTVTGEVVCWGATDNGTVGVPNTGDPIGDNETPYPEGLIGLGQPAISLGVGTTGACAVLEDKTVRCWGTITGSPDGSLRLDELPADADPVDLGAPARLVRVTGNSSCALLEDDSIRCWGLDVDDIGNHAEGVLYGYDEVPSAAPAVRLW